jgi:nucleotide-binding universal stress UspA family protein
MIKSILVGIGGTEFTDIAAERALEIAKIHNAQVTAVTVVDFKRLQKLGPVPPGAGSHARRLREIRTETANERIEAAVTKLDGGCQDLNVSCNIEREIGDPFEMLISHARYNDLIIFGLRSLFTYGFVKEPRDALIRLVSQGVRPILAVSSELRPVKRVLIAYSGSMESAKTMRYYVQLKPWADVKLRIVHFGERAEHGTRLLADARSYCRTHGFDTETDLVEAPAREGLIKYAQENDFDLIVMGNSARNAIMRQLIGDTLLHTIQEADRPLFLAQ